MASVRRQKCYFGERGQEAYVEERRGGIGHYNVNRNAGENKMGHGHVWIVLTLLHLGDELRVKESPRPLMQRAIDRDNVTTAE